MKSMLTNGAQGPEQRSKAMYRSVASDVVIVRNSHGEPLKRALGEPLPTVCVCSTNAPNLAYDRNHKTEFLNDPDSPSPTFNVGDDGIPTYKQAMKDILRLNLDTMREMGVQVPVIPGIGQGTFMHSKVEAEGRRLFAEALAEVAKENPNAFKGFVFSDINADLCAAVRKAFDDNGLTQEKGFEVVNKSPLDVAQRGAENGIKTGMLNAGDPSCVPGQFFEEGHIALEEWYALSTTMVLSQSPSMNPHVLNNMQGK